MLGKTSTHTIKLVNKLSVGNTRIADYAFIQHWSLFLKFVWSKVVQSTNGSLFKQWFENLNLKSTNSPPKKDFNQLSGAHRKLVKIHNIIPFKYRTWVILDLGPDFEPLLKKLT